jgi:hypothetical protein
MQGYADSGGAGVGTGVPAEATLARYEAKGLNTTRNAATAVNEKQIRRIFTFVALSALSAGNGKTAPPRSVLGPQ